MKHGVVFLSIKNQIFQVSWEGEGEGEGDDGPREQSEGGERDAGGPDQAPLQGRYYCTICTVVTGYVVWLTA